MSEETMLTRNIMVGDTRGIKVGQDILINSVVYKVIGRSGDSIEVEYPDVSEP